MDLVLLRHPQYSPLPNLTIHATLLIHAGLNTSPETQLREFGNRTDLTIKWMLQLVMAVECDAFVGTRGVSLHPVVCDCVDWPD
jgi:hypothetical protein